MAATALAAVATPAQKRGGENEQAVLGVVVDAFLQGRVLSRRRLIIFRLTCRRLFTVVGHIRC